MPDSGCPHCGYEFAFGPDRAEWRTGGEPAAGYVKHCPRCLRWVQVPKPAQPQAATAERPADAAATRRQLPPGRPAVSL